MENPSLEEKAEFFDIALEMLCIANFKGYFILVNQMFEETLGWKEEELYSQPFIEFVHPEDREATIQAVKDLFQGKHVNNFTNRYLCKNGEYKFIEWKSISNLEKGCIYAVARDITEKLNWETKIRESEAKLKAFVQGLPIGLHFYWLNADGELIFEGANQEALKLLKLDPKIEIDRPIEQVFPPLITTEIPTIYKNIASNGGIHEFPKVE